MWFMAASAAWSGWRRLAVQEAFPHHRDVEVHLATDAAGESINLQHPPGRPD